jgi:glycosyltransferase involved in cell wall biosynthesis
MPLWDDERSLTRFPTKMGQYVAAGRPIVTAGVGEVPSYLKHGETALFYQPGSVENMAEQINEIIEKPELGDRIARTAYEEVLPRMDYRSRGESAADWIKDLN